MTYTDRALARTAKDRAVTAGSEKPVRAVPARGDREIACDESGSDGENLVGGNTDVFAHAGVHVPIASAEGALREIRGRIRSPALEYKANHLLREKHRPVLVWMLGPSGPIHGQAQVHLIDKAFFLVGRIVDLLTGEAAGTPGCHPLRDERARSMAVTLYRDGLRTYGPQRWRCFLHSANGLMRTRNHGEVTGPVDAFFRTAGLLRSVSARGGTDEIMDLLRRSRPRADAFRARLLDDADMLPVLDPLLPAIVRAVTHWSADGRPVSIVHDQQNTITEELVLWVQRISGEPRPADPHSAVHRRLAALTLVDSRSDPRVQLADFLAGVARKIASDALNGRGDEELTALLRPYVDPLSLWSDAEFWRSGPPGDRGPHPPS